MAYFIESQPICDTLNANILHFPSLLILTVGGVLASTSLPLTVTNPNSIQLHVLFHLSISAKRSIAIVIMSCYCLWIKPQWDWNSLYSASCLFHLTISAKCSLPTFIMSLNVDAPKPQRDWNSHYSASCLFHLIISAKFILATFILSCLVSVVRDWNSQHIVEDLPEHGHILKSVSPHAAPQNHHIHYLCAGVVSLFLFGWDPFLYWFFGTLHYGKVYLLHHWTW